MKSNHAIATTPKAAEDAAAWKEIVRKYQKPSTWRALWQIVDTLVPIAALWYLMYLCLPVSLWLVVPLAVLMGALLVRVFIIFHDCGHGSFFKSPAANDTVGFHRGHPDAHAVLSLALGTRHSSRRLRATWTGAARVTCGR